jgi:ribosomal protein S12 methylthiotransferase accessory factor YcaO
MPFASVVAHALQSRFRALSGQRDQVGLHQVLHRHGVQLDGSVAETLAQRQTVQHFSEFVAVLAHQRWAPGRGAKRGPGRLLRPKSSCS